MNEEEIDIEDFRKQFSYYSNSNKKKTSIFDKMRALILSKDLTKRWIAEFLFELKLLYSEIENEISIFNNLICWLLDGFQSHNGQLNYQLQDHVEYSIDESKVHHFYLPTSLFHPEIVEFTIISSLFVIPILSSSVENMKKIERLILPKLHIKQLPDTLGNLGTLKYLNLNHNLISFLPDSICNLSSLEYFYLKNNKLTELPEEIGNLENLEYLDIRDNTIHKLPRSIEMLQSLNDWSLTNLKTIFKSSTR